jgi:beta-barrel assembly-enhancing protease
MQKIWAAALWLAVASVVHASTAKHADAAPTPEEQIRAVKNAIDQAQADLRNNDDSAAAAVLDAAIHANGFAKLPDAERYQALLLAGLVDYDRDKHASAHDLLTRATSFSQSDSIAWYFRLAAAYDLNDYKDSAHCVITIAQRWPDTLEKVSRQSIYTIDFHLEGDPQLQRDYLQALFDVEWNDPDGEASVLWRQLARLWLDRGDTQKAAIAAARITSSRVALAMLVDVRFDSITQKNVEAFDVDRLAQKEIADTRARTAAEKDLLSPVVVLQGLLLDTQHYDEALAIADDVIAKSKDGKGPSLYKDFDDRYIWLLDQRARTLARMGRWDEAADQWVRAARRPEQGQMNVSQILNLGQFYADLQRPKDALATIAELGNMSPYGRMQLEMVKLEVALQQQDKAAIAEHLAYMREHRADAIATWQNALLLSGDLDAAGDLLVERLQSAQWRSDALTDMQHYANIRTTPVDAERLKRWNTVISQPKVQQALAKVGRIEHFNLEPAQT